MLWWPEVRKCSEMKERKRDRKEGIKEGKKEEGRSKNSFLVFMLFTSEGKIFSRNLQQISFSISLAKIKSHDHL